MTGAPNEEKEKRTAIAQATILIYQVDDNDERDVDCGWRAVIRLVPIVNGVLYHCLRRSMEVARG